MTYLEQHKTAFSSCGNWKRLCEILAWEPNALAERRNNTYEPPRGHHSEERKLLRNTTLEQISSKGTRLGLSRHKPIMADFLSNLWESVFQAGPTPTLLIATNVTFAALQATLFALLIATYSIHFIILSILSGGLWYAINWFAHELAAAQAAEEKADKLRKEKRRGTEADTAGGGEIADDEGEETEVEGDYAGLRESKSSLGGSSQGFENVEDVQDERVRQEIVRAVQSSSAVGSGGQGARQRAGKGAEGRDLSGEISTDSEWEKVEDGR